ncbi:MAG TPA: 3-dehydroquinate synthase [Paenalcaligenes sp.]|nr:3-dehydroquinate synthase [Paenalcaligenes sp.]
MSTVVEVDTQGGQYPIHIGPGRLNHLAASVPADVTRIAIVTNPTVYQHYGDLVQTALGRSGKEVLLIELPDGEEHKHWQTLNSIFDELLRQQFDRKSLLVALGGGVVGDIAGFAAACYMRGIRFMQVPTTLLAQVDSSVGGKTAINHPLGKNMVGAFYQPIAVEIDTDVLSTLPGRELTAGLAEVIKYGFIEDYEFLQWCEDNAGRLMARDEQAIRYAIQRSCEIKAAVVSEDERESGKRALLNFGHTFGHAIEAGLGYGEWLHGEAVGCGMVMAARLSEQLGYLNAQQVQRVTALVQAVGAPIAPPQWSAARWLELMQSDKKAQAGALRFVVLQSLGKAAVQEVEPDIIEQVIASFTE